MWTITLEQRVRSTRVNCGILLATPATSTQRFSPIRHGAILLALGAYWYTGCSISIVAPHRSQQLAFAQLFQARFQHSGLKWGKNTKNYWMQSSTHVLTLRNAQKREPLKTAKIEYFLSEFDAVFEAIFVFISSIHVERWKTVLSETIFWKCMGWWKWQNSIVSWVIGQNSIRIMKLISPGTNFTKGDSGEKENIQKNVRAKREYVSGFSTLVENPFAPKKPTVFYPHKIRPGPGSEL